MQLSCNNNRKVPEINFEDFVLSDRYARFLSFDTSVVALLPNPTSYSDFVKMKEEDKVDYWSRVTFKKALQEYLSEKDLRFSNLFILEANSCGERNIAKKYLIYKSGSSYFLIQFQLSPIGWRINKKSLISDKQYSLVIDCFDKDYFKNNVDYQNYTKFCIISSISADNYISKILPWKEYINISKFLQ